MKLFLDTAELSEIEKAAATGLVDGVTTNPSLVAKAGVPFKDLLQRICALVDGPISAEVTALDAPGMIREAHELAPLHRNIVIKIPLTWEGMKATKVLTKEGIKTNVTLCFSPAQALLAAKAGATYVSPFLGRLDDVGHNGVALIADMRTIFDRYDFKTQILAASIRHVDHIVSVARLGADVATLPYGIYMQLIQHPLTDLGIQRFMKDWENAKK